MQNEPQNIFILYSIEAIGSSVWSEQIIEMKLNKV